MICWSCERAAGAGERCASCGAVQAPDLTADHYKVLGITREFGIDLKAAEGRFRELSRAVHPDRFATADARARRFSMQRTVQLNEAWKTLRDPVRRAEYLLSLEGWEIGSEAGASRPGAAPAERERIPVPAALLGEVLELREELADARGARDDRRVLGLAIDVRGRLDAALTRVAEGLVSVDSPPQRAGVLEGVAQQLLAIRYWRRFLDEVEVHEEAEQARRDDVGPSGTSQEGKHVA